VGEKVPEDFMKVSWTKDPLRPRPESPVYKLIFTKGGICLRVVP